MPLILDFMFPVLNIFYSFQLSSAFPLNPLNHKLPKKKKKKEVVWRAFLSQIQEGSDPFIERAGSNPSEQQNLEG